MKSCLQRDGLVSSAELAFNLGKNMTKLMKSCKTYVPFFFSFAYTTSPAANTIVLFLFAYTTSPAAKTIVLFFFSFAYTTSPAAKTFVRTSIKLSLKFIYSHIVSWTDCYGGNLYIEGWKWKSSKYYRIKKQIENFHIYPLDISIRPFTWQH